MTTLAPQRSRQSYDNGSLDSSVNVDKVVQSVTNATKRLSQISTNTNSSNQKKTHSRIGPWKLGRTLGRGSTGRVRLAKNVDTGKLAAIKIVPKSNFKKIENPKYRRDSVTNKGLPYGIEREIIIMKLISHPNIMGLYDVWENKNDLYLILEYIEGGELFDYLIKRGKLQEFEAVNYFKQIIKGIGYLHQFNICHRDLKPENLLLDFNKSIKIADFGMAALEVGEKLLETSCGSPHYASPEIVAGRTYHGAPSDIWSSGIILFALLTGHLPFDDENIRKLLLKVQNGRFLMPQDLSLEAKDLIVKMLKVNPEERITINEILEHPLLLKYPEPATSLSANASLPDIPRLKANTVESPEKIDNEILQNLSVLFHNCSESTLISRLVSPSQSPEKMFYSMLLKYRDEHKISATTDENETDASLGKTKNTIPRSASIVKTTVVNHATGEKHTTIKKISHSSSHHSSKSLKSQKSKTDRALSNISNNHSTYPRNFKASTSFTKKRNLLNNQKISPSSTRSGQRRSKSTQPPKLQPPLPTKIKRNPTGLTELNHIVAPVTTVQQSDPIKPNVLPPPPTMDIDKEKAVEPMLKENTLLEKTLQLRKSFANTSTADFSRMVLSLLDGGVDKEDNTNIDQKNTPVKPKRKKGDISDYIRLERELAAKVKRINSQRDHLLKEKEDKEERLRQEKQEERDRELLKLREKQKQAFSRVQSRNIADDFTSNRLSQRYVTEPVKPSLDPKLRKLSVLRATSLGGTSPLKNNNVNTNASKVLKNLGIEVEPPKRPLSSHVKTTSSKNLSGYLAGNLDPLEGDKENITLGEFNKIEKDTTSILSYPDVHETDTQSHRRKSHLRNIDENSHSFFAPTDNRFDSTKEELIPNPRFSRMSFGNLFDTSKYDLGDVTIMNSIGSSGGTVVRKSLGNESTKSLTKSPDNKTTKPLTKSPTHQNLEISGLGILSSKSRSARSSLRGDYSHDNTFDGKLSKSEFRSVNLELADETTVSHSILQKEAIDDGKHDDSTLRGEFTSHQDLGDLNLQPHLESDISNLDIISSTTMAEIGHLNKTQPSLVEHDSSKSSLGEENVDETIGALYSKYGSLYEKQTVLKSKTSDAPEPRDNEAFKGYKEKSPVTSQRDLSFAESRNFQVNHDNSPAKDAASNYSTTRNKENDSKATESEELQRLETVTKKEKVPHRYSSLARSAKENESSHIFKPVTSDTQTVATRQDEGDNHNDAKATSLTPESSRESTLNSLPIIEDTKRESIFKRISLIPRRRAPRAPSTNRFSRGYDKFSKIEVPQKASKKEVTKTPRKENWFKKFLSAITAPRIDSKPSEINANICIVDSSLRSDNLMRAIKNQLELKRVEGSVNEVQVDEEFGLINGVIPSRFSSGRKLKFKIEIIDLNESSSLYITKVRGSEKGFRNLVNIVKLVNKQEEDAAKRIKTEMTQA